jgi:hypothetical protein
VLRSRAALLGVSTYSTCRRCVNYGARSSGALVKKFLLHKRKARAFTAKILGRIARRIAPRGPDNKALEKLPMASGILPSIILGLLSQKQIAIYPTV